MRAAQSQNLRKFIQPLRGIDGKTGIPVAVADSVAQPWWQPGVTHYTIDILQFTDQLHPDLPNPTRLWGFGQPTKSPVRHLGGIIAAKRGDPVQITFRNKLPSAHLFPVDRTIMGTEGQDNRTDIHLHGGYVPWTSDGGPFAWWDPNGHTGPSFVNNSVLGVPNPSPNQAEYYYPNDQSARLVWYHDHSIGITRLNAYAGIASGYVIADPFNESAFEAANPGLPSVAGAIYLIFQDKIFFGAAGPAANYGANAGPGDLFYANTYDPALFGPAGLPSFGGGLLTPFPFPSCVPEFFGDTILVNGAAYPVLEVEARPVRIRMLNACNARFLNPRLVATAGTVFPDNAEPKANSFGPGMIQLASEGGYLPLAAPVAGKNLPQLLLAPAERADLVCDFSGIAAGTEFILYSDAPGPFPGGAAIFDFYPKNPKTPTSLPGFGPNTRTLLKIRVKAATSAVTPLPAVISMVPTALSETPLVAQTPGIPTPIPTSILVGGVTYPVTLRTLTLNEGFDEYGRLAQFLGTDTALAGTTPGFFGRPYVGSLGTPTEVAAAGSVEVWQIANLTADTHPIHFHLVNVQILYRQPIKTKGFTGTFIINPNGQPIAPDANELGYKETVRMNPGEVTVVIMKFDLPTGLPFVTPPSPRTGGHEYVWHCHILEHEEHDMMRPLVVT